MEKMLKKAGCALLAVVALAGCRNEEQALPEGSRTVVFHAGTPGTRSVFDSPEDGVYPTLWTGNESEIQVSLNGREAVAAEVTPSEDGKTATFAATFDSAEAIAPFVFRALSPASAGELRPDGDGWDVWIDPQQVPLAYSVDEAVQLLAGKSTAYAEFPDEMDIHFSHLTAYGCVTLRNLEIGEASVSKVELAFETPLAGSWSWSEDGTFTPDEAVSTITLKTGARGDLWFACAPADVSGTALTVSVHTSAGVLVREITFPEGRAFASGKVARFSVDMDGIEPVLIGDEFNRLPDVSYLQEGMEVIFLDNTLEWAMGPQNNNYRTAVSEGFVLDGSRIVVMEGDVRVFTVEAGNREGTWSFKDEDGYIAATSSTIRNNMVSKAEKDDYASWILTVDDSGEMDVEAYSGRRNHLRYNPNQPRFSCYQSGQRSVWIYVKGEPIPEPDDPLTEFDEYGSYVSAADRQYVKGKDQISRTYETDGTLTFAIVRASDQEQLVLSGIDPDAAKGDAVQVSVQHRKGLATLLEADFNLKVVKVDDTKMWLGDGSGQGFIIKK